MNLSRMRKKKYNQLLKKPAGKFTPVDFESVDSKPDWMTRAVKNNRYTVMIDDNAKMSGGFTAIRAMIQRHDDKPIANHWRAIQSIKNEIFGPETVGVEYYPAESELMDDHNIYWLFILPDDKVFTPIIRR